MNPTCREIEGLLSPYLDRELDPLVARRVDEHVTSCPACSEALAAMREAGRILAAAGPLRSEAEWEALALRVEMAIDREEARVFQEAATKELVDLEERLQATPATAMRTFEEAPAEQAEPSRSRARGFGWWAYGSGAIAVAMLVLLLWPWFQEHVEEGPPAPPARTPTFDTRARHEEPAPSTVPQQENLSEREQARKPDDKRNASPPSERDLASSSERAAAPPTTAEKATGADKDAEQPAIGALRAEETPSPGTAPSRAQSAEPPASSDEQAKLEKSAPSGSAPNAQKAVPQEKRKAAAKEDAGGTPQPISKSETSPVWRSDPSSNGFRGKTMSKGDAPASDTPSPPPPIKLISETEWAEMGEIQTHEALKAGTEKSLTEASYVLESFLKEYPSSVFRPRASANLVRTTAALVQLNPNLWCERAVAALDNWKLEKPSPAINLEAEITTIEGGCLK